METVHSTGNDIQIHVNGTTLCYDDVGKGSIPILFIHGFPFDKSSWQPQLEFLSKTHRVLAYDIRGFGKSTEGTEKASIRLYADDLVKLMDALQIQKAVVCGLSMGGYILLNAVSRYPERFEAIILSDTQCIADSAEGKEKRYKTITQIEEGGLTDFTEGFMKNIFCKESLETKKVAVEKIKSIVLSTSPATVTGALRALAERDETCSMLDQVSVATLILCGKEDVVTPPAQSERMHAEIKNSTLRILEKAGHLSNMEQPDEFNRSIIHFLSTHVK